MNTDRKRADEIMLRRVEPPAPCGTILPSLTELESLQRDLVRDLHRVTDLLWRQGENRWAEWLNSDRDLIRQGDVFGLDHLLSAYAGVGSINDLWLSRTNSFTPTLSDRSTQPRDYDGTDESVQVLLRRIWEQASLIRRTLRVMDAGG